MSMKIYTSNDQTLTLPYLTDVINGVVTPITGATITFDLVDANGSAVLNDVAMTYVTGTQSDYAGAITSAFNPDLVTNPNPYSLVISASFSGKSAQWTRSNVTVALRTI